MARAHRKVAASRADFLHRTSTRLVRDHDVIVIEDLAVKNMVRNRRLAKAISACRTLHDRDVNAAKNIRAAGRAVSACGGDVRHSESSSRVRSSAKQEPQPARAGIPALQSED